MSEYIPYYHPEDLLKAPVEDKPYAYVKRKTYLDGVISLVNEFGPTITLFPDGGVHREPKDGLPAYKTREK